MSEQSFRSSIISHIRKNSDFICLRHEDVRMRSIPDLSITGNGVTTWWEFKFGWTSWYDYPQNQLHHCKKLALQGFLKYVIQHQGYVAVVEIGQTPIFQYTLKEAALKMITLHNEWGQELGNSVHGEK